MATNDGFGSWRHLAGRFFGALSPVGPAPTDERWALDRLLPEEQALWRRMSGPDRRHAVAVARDTVGRLGPGRAGREVVAAALLHDVGKVESGFGVLARAWITLVAVAVGRSRLLSWAQRTDAAGTSSIRARVGRYLAHDRIGADLLRRAGSATLTVRWTAEHHLSPERWTVDGDVAAALKAADGD